jgi:hypothetical protein
MAKTRRSSLPDLIDTSTAGLRRWARAVQESVGLMTGDSAVTATAKLDSAVTYRDLIEQGFAILAPEGRDQFVVPGTDEGAYSTIPPPAPTGFTVARLPYKMRLTWDVPTYSNHYATEILRSAADNLTAAELVGLVTAGISQWEDGYASGAVYYWIRFVSTALIPGAYNAISGTGATSQPGDATGLNYTLEETGVRIYWTAVTAADLDVYELRYGATWETAAALASIKSNFYLWRVQATGTYRIWVRARDVGGYYSGSASSIDIVIANPATSSIGFTLSGESVMLGWSAIGGSFLIDYYEVRYGTTWAGGTLVNRTFSTALLQRVDWSGVRRFWVAGRDVAGNYGSPMSVDVTIVAPGAVGNLRADVIDNNVLLFWQASATGTLPIATYELRKGADFASAAEIGDKFGLFTSVFEMASGSYTYWVRPRDTAGTFGTASPVTVTVQQPPDFVLYSDTYVDLSAATLSSATYSADGVVLPVNTTQTYDQNYSANAWTNDADAIAAGYPVYAQPAPTTGYIEAAVDLGTAIPSTTVTVTPTLAIIAGSPTNAIQISHKLNSGDSWTDLTAGSTGFISTSFRYVKVRLTATTSGSGVGLYRCSQINVKMAVKQRTDSGQGSAVAGDTGGTTVTLNYAFVDLLGPPVIQPGGTTPIIAVVDFTDAPNPTTFKVLCFDLAGARVSCSFSWTARGV